MEVEKLRNFKIINDDGGLIIRRNTQINLTGSLELDLPG